MRPSRIWARRSPHRWIKILYQAVENSMGKSKDPCVLSGEIYDKNETSPENAASGDVVATIITHQVQMLLCCFYNDFDRVLENARICRKYFIPASPAIIKTFYHFQTGLARLALYWKKPLPVRAMYRLLIWNSMRTVKKSASLAPMNYRHKYDLLVAELGRIKGKERRAMVFFDKAVSGARKNDFLLDEALVCERAAAFYREGGFREIAAVYLTRAYRRYVKWGIARQGETI